MNRRDFIKASAAATLVGDQGPFDFDQDQGWQTLLFTKPSDKLLRNPALGLVGYTWEENGPALDVRSGHDALASAIEQMASLPFVDVLYMRLDWRDVQKQPGKLDLPPVWHLTFDAAKRHGLRVAFRIQMSTPERQPDQLAIPDFLVEQVPLVNIGRNFREPRYDHPAFQKAFADLIVRLGDELSGLTIVDWLDLMQYGFWGEGHTSNLPNPFPNPAIAQRTFEKMTALQLEVFKTTAVAVNTQPDISHVGNRNVLKMAMQAGAWLRTDSIRVEEPIQIDEITNRPPHLAAIIEDGEFRHYDTDTATLENFALHALDVKANYWALWTEAARLRQFYSERQEVFDTLRRRLGYRIRPAWVWQRKRDGRMELIVAVTNSGVAGVPGVLWLNLASSNGKVRLRESLDPGQPHGAGVREAAFLLPQGFVGPVQLTCELEVRPSSFRKVTWACDEPVIIDVKGPDDKGWRKGV